MSQQMSLSLKSLALVMGVLLAAFALRRVAVFPPARRIQRSLPRLELMADASRNYFVYVGAASLIACALHALQRVGLHDDVHCTACDHPADTLPEAPCSPPTDTQAGCHAAG